MQASQLQATGCRPSCNLAPQLASCRQARLHAACPHDRSILASKRSSRATRCCFLRRRAAGAMAVYISSMIPIMSDAIGRRGAFRPDDAEPAAPVESGFAESSNVAALREQLNKLNEEADKLADELEKTVNDMLVAASDNELQQLQMCFNDVMAKQDRVDEMRKALLAQLTVSTSGSGSPRRDNKAALHHEPGDSGLSDEPGNRWQEVAALLVSSSLQYLQCKLAMLAIITAAKQQPHTASPAHGSSTPRTAVGAPVHVRQRSAVTSARAPVLCTASVDGASVRAWPAAHRSLHPLVRRRPGAVKVYAQTGSGGEPLPQDLEHEFEELLGETTGSVKNALLRNKVTLVRNSVVSEEALRALTQADLEGFDVPKADAGVLKLKFPSPTTAGTAASSSPVLQGSAPASNITRAELEETVRRALERSLVREQVGQAARRKSLSEGAVGLFMIEDATPMKDAEYFLGPLQPEPVTADILALAKDIQDATAEDPTDPKIKGLQKPMAQLMRKIATGGGVPGLEIIEANRFGYKLPDGKTSCIDVALSLVPEKRWAAVMSVVEWKLLCQNPAQKNNTYKEAVGQLQTRWGHVRLFQQDRSFMLCAVMDKHEIQLWRLYANGNVECSKRFTIEYTPDNEGWQVLVAFVRAPIGWLGYVIKPTPEPFRTAAGQLVSDFFMVADHGKRQVFTANLGSTTSTSTTDTVIVKVASEAATMREVLPLQAVQTHKAAVFPQYIAHGKLDNALSPMLTHYLITRPYGQHLQYDDLTPNKLAKYMGDTVTAIELLEREGWVQCDIKPANLILDSSTGTVILNDYHLSMRLPAPVEAVSGALVTRAIRVDNPPYQHTVASQLESAALSYFYLASKGKALRWRNETAPAAVADMKASTMFTPHGWHMALAECQEELQPMLSKLYNVIYRRGNSELYFAQPVTVKEVREALKG